MPNLGGVRIVISEPVHAELLAIKQRMQEEQRRQVTFSEVIDTLIERAGEREDQGA